MTDPATLLRAANDQIKAGNHQEAKPLIDQLVVMAPTSAQVLCTAAITDLALGLIESGVDRLARALSLDPTLSNGTQIKEQALALAFNRAVAAHNGHDVDDARTLYRAVLRLDPSCTAAAKNLALLERCAAPEKLFTVGVTTFDKRFEVFLKPLLEKIKESAPDIEVVICVNGNNGEPFNENYRKEFLHFCAEHKNTFPIVFTEFRSLARMWNSIIVNASHDHILLLNDDVTISDGRLFPMTAQAVLTHDCSLKLNNSWSHVLLKREEIDVIGYFDERLLGIGEEDTDMEYRYERQYGYAPRWIECPYIVNEFSSIRQDNVRPGIGKYSAFNREFLLKVKYDMTKEVADRMISPSERLYPYERFFWENKHKI